MKRVVLNDHRVGPWVCERLGSRWDPSCGNVIGLERDGALIAGVVFDNFLGRSVSMHIASEGAHWLNRSFITACFAYPFKQLGVGKVIGPVDSTNEKARRFNEHLGFEVECLIKDAGREGDLLLFTMTRQQCRWVH